MSLTDTQVRNLTSGELIREAEHVLNNSNGTVLIEALAQEIEGLQEIEQEYVKLQEKYSELLEASEALTCALRSALLDAQDRGTEDEVILDSSDVGLIESLETLIEGLSDE